MEEILGPAVFATSLFSNIICIDLVYLIFMCFCICHFLTCIIALIKIKVFIKSVSRLLGYYHSMPNLITSYFYQSLLTLSHLCNLASCFCKTLEAPSVQLETKTFHFPVSNLINVKRLKQTWHKLILSCTQS